jgi:hypothetical protein
METIKITTSQNVEIDYAVASLGDRIIARIIDVGIFGGNNLCRRYADICGRIKHLLRKRSETG